jgi:hypothetical protein
MLIQNEYLRSDTRESHRILAIAIPAAKCIIRSYSHPVRVGVGSMRVSEEPAWREIAGVPPPFPHGVRVVLCVKATR